MVKMSMLLTLLFTTAAQATAPETSISSQYSHLNSNNLQRTELVSAANDRLNKSYNFGTFQNVLRLLFPDYNTSNSSVSPAANGAFLHTENGRGLHSDKVNLITSSGDLIPILDTKSPGFERFRIVQSIASPDLNHVAVILSENQSTLFYQFVIYHIESRRLSRFDKKIYANLNTGDYAPRWTSGAEFNFPEAIPSELKKIKLHNYNVDTNTSSVQLRTLGSPLPLITPNATIGETPNSNLSVEILTGTGEFIAEDGVKISATVLYRKDIEWSGNNPVLINSYGGFNVPNNPPAKLIRNSVEKDFIRRHGVIIYPQLRGGHGETDDWYRSAMGAHRKKRTFLDLIAVAKGLVEQGYTSPRNIISMGGSNGGLTAAASALLSPESFGLIISRSAPLDILSIADLDPWTWEGWAFDYGNPENPADVPYILEYSPVELVARQKHLTFLIATGAHDETVNVAHSLKLYAALRDRGGEPDRVHLLISTYGGHSAGSGRDISDLLYTGRMWAFIYNYLGWTR